MERTSTLKVSFKNAGKDSGRFAQYMTIHSGRKGSLVHSMRQFDGVKGRRHSSAPSAPNQQKCHRRHEQERRQQN